MTQIIFKTMWECQTNTRKKIEKEHKVVSQIYETESSRFYLQKRDIMMQFEDMGYFAYKRNNVFAPSKWIELSYRFGL